MAARLFSMSIDSSISVLEELFKNFERAESGDEDRFVSILVSKPGLGKSATISKMCKRMGYTLIDLNLACIEPTDIIGLGAREKKNGVWQTLPALPAWAETALAGNCVIFVDEFNNTTQDVLSGFQKMFSDFVIDGKKLPRTTHIVGACNPPGSDALYAARKLSGAFRRRLCMIPVVDDYSYVMGKHNFEMPRSYLNQDYGDIADYCHYDGMSSAVVDNVFNILKYTGLSDFEKVALVSGFGSGAFNFARELGLFPDSVMASGKVSGNSDCTYSEWKKNPGDQVGEYQQILWGNESITKSVSYSRSKKFLSRVTNENVYVALYGTLKERFEVEYELDEAKLPESRLDAPRASA